MYRHGSALKPTRSAYGAMTLYAAWPLILLMGMCKGEVFDLRWADVNFASEELSIARQLQRVAPRLIHKQRTKTDGSTDVLPLPPSAQPRYSPARPSRRQCVRRATTAGKAISSSQRGRADRSSLATSTRPSSPAVPLLASR